MWPPSSSTLSFSLSTLSRHFSLALPLSSLPLSSLPLSLQAVSIFIGCPHVLIGPHPHWSPLHPRHPCPHWPPSLSVAPASSSAPILVGPHPHRPPLSSSVAPILAALSLLPVGHLYLQEADVARFQCARGCACKAGAAYQRQVHYYRYLLHVELCSVHQSLSKTSTMSRRSTCTSGHRFTSPHICQHIVSPYNFFCS